MNFLKSLSAALALFAAVGAAEATVISGNFNQRGFDVISIHVATNALVDFSYTGGYGDPSFSLYDASGNHLISNDDTDISLYSHLTRQLNAGNYSFVVSACCGFASFLPGYTFSNTDGFNLGSYLVGGTGTLAALTAGLNSDAQGHGAAYQLTIQNVDIGSADVPEPASLALLGASLAALSLARRRKQKQG